MIQKLSNKIEAKDRSINALLKDQKFTIDYFQREYRWQKKHIESLVEDLTSAFLRSYSVIHNRTEVSNYESYYIGPTVFSINPENNKKSIIDGQQRITSLTLLLIYLNHRQKDNISKVSISELIFSEKYGDKSFNMSDEFREPCLNSLFKDGDYKLTDTDDETVHNMLDRYRDIETFFPEEIDEKALPYFIDWLTENVILVEIIAYSDDNAYTIFETMNDRGLNLTPTEMLKGFVLSKVKNKKKRDEINAIWKEEIKKLHEYEETADLSFFQAWFRAKYAISIRPGKAGSVDQDFELIGSRFHNWFKDNHKEIFELNTEEDFYEFFKYQFPYFVKCYLKIWDSQLEFESKMPFTYYVGAVGIADSLQMPLLLSPIVYNDKVEEVERKVEFVSRYIETFTIRRTVNYRKFSANSIKYTMFNLIKSIRNSDLKSLGNTLTKEVNDIQEKWDGVWEFGLHGQNKHYIKHVLSRVTSYLDSSVGKDTNYSNYMHPIGKQFEIEHIWANKFSEHRDEFDQETDFQGWRNSLGALLLLPQGTNQSFNSDKYEDKLEHYIKENTFAQTLHPTYYAKNPNFLKSDQIKTLGFTPHPKFKKVDIEARQKLLQRICEDIWSVKHFS